MCFARTHTKRVVIETELSMNAHVARLVLVQSGPVNPEKIPHVQVPRFLPERGDEKFEKFTKFTGRRQPRVARAAPGVYTLGRGRV